MSNSENGSEPGRGEISPADREALRQRASGLGKRVEQAKARHAPPPEPTVRGAAMGQAFKIVAELLVGVGVGGFIGWILDRQLGTQPWLLVVFLIFGFAAGMLNVIRTAQKMQAGSEPLQRAAPSVKDDDEDA